MKKFRITLMVAMLAMVTAVSAQTSFGIKGGINMSNFSGKNASDIYKAKIGFNVGLAGDFEFAPGMAIQSGLFLTTKGANFKNSDNSSVDLMYLQVPVHFAYKADIMPGTRIVFHAGPYVAYGISGNIKSGSDKIDIFKDRTIDLPIIGAVGSKGANRFDAGLGLGVGAEFGRFLVDLGWDMGLVKLYENGELKNMNAYLSVGYMF